MAPHCAEKVIAEAEPEPPQRSSSHQFLSGLRSADRVLFVSHIHPDPDSLGSMLGLSHLVRSTIGRETILTQDGSICRAENKAMVHRLQLDLIPLDRVKFGARDAVVMVDSQPGTGRHSVKYPNVYAVIDHHSTPGELTGVKHRVIRPDIGATCTLVTNYLTENRITIPPRVATGLYYGIETEVGGLPREASTLDDIALQYLFPLVNHELLAEIRNAQLPQSHFECLFTAMKNAEVFGRTVFTLVDPIAQQEQAAEVSDFLIRHEELDWAFCFGIREETMIISVRTSLADVAAGQILQQAVGELGTAGGHDRRAGGCVCVKARSASEIHTLYDHIRHRLLKLLQAPTQAFPFIKR